MPTPETIPNQATFDLRTRGNDGDERAIFQRLVFSLSGGVRERKKQKVSEKRNGKKEKGEQAESPYYS